MSRWVSAIGLVLLLCAAESQPPAPGPKEVIPNNQPPPTEEHRKAPEDARGTEQLPFIVKIAPSPGAYPETDDVQDDRKKKASMDESLVFWAKVTGLATIGLLIATALLWIFTARLWKTTKRSVDLAEQALIDLERAYVFAKVRITEATVNIDGKTQSVRIAISFHNYGKSPAILSSIRGYSLIDDQVPQALIDVVNSEQTIPDGLVIAPRKKYTIHINRRMTDEEAQDVDLRNQGLFCCGLINYRDPFGQGRGHQTGFCWRYNPTANERSL